MANVERARSNADHRQRRTQATPAPVARLVQRAPPSARRCACGGGCPRCRAKAESSAAALTVNEPGDAWEREADRMADAVMAGASAPPSDAAGPSGATLRRCACGGSCPSCRAKREEEDETNLLHREDAGPSAPAVAPPIVHDVLASPGRPLEAGTRAFMEAGFGAVRVHADARAAESARAVDAHAYAVGSDVVFGAGRYAPGTEGGDRLIAHELAHVVQGGGVLRRQETRAEDYSSDDEIEPPPNAVTVDVLDPLSSSLRIGGWGLPSPRDILDGLDALRRFGQPPRLPTDPLPPLWPQPQFTEEELLQAACRAFPPACETPLPIPLPEPPDFVLPEPRLRLPRLVYYDRLVLDHFVFDESGVPDRHRMALDRTSTEMIDDPSLVTDVTGHTDTRGDPGHNQRLSERRARSIADYLLARQVPQLQVWNVTGAGENHPRFPGDATDDLAASRNRRVELEMCQLVWEWTFPGPRLQLGPPSTLGVTDERERVRPGERALYDRLTAFMGTARTEISALLAQSPPAAPWATADNENIVEMLRILDRLIADLRAENRVVRFTQSTGGTAAASYAWVEDEIMLRRFSTDTELATVAFTLVHEFTHVMQDETAEELLRAGRMPLEHSAADERWIETEGKRNGAYFGALLGLAGHPLDLISTMEVDWYVERFEIERSGSPDEQRSARGEIAYGINQSYAGQISRNAPARTYLIEIRSNRDAVLVGVGGAESSLGRVPEAVTTRAELDTLLEARVRALSTFGSLFQGPGGTTLQVIQFVVFDGNRKVGSFGIR